MKLTHRGLVKRGEDGRILASTEEGIFKALGINYVPPARKRIAFIICASSLIF